MIPLLRLIMRVPRKTDQALISDLFQVPESVIRRSVANMVNIRPTYPAEKLNGKL